MEESVWLLLADETDPLRGRKLQGRKDTRVARKMATVAVATRRFVYQKSAFFKPIQTQTRA